MPKDFFCKRIEDNNICGEKDPEKFEKGRYSICKECRRKETYKSIKKKRDKEQEDNDEKELETIEKEPNNTILIFYKNQTQLLEKIKKLEIQNKELFEKFEYLNSQVEFLKKIQLTEISLINPSKPTIIEDFNKQDKFIIEKVKTKNKALAKDIITKYSLTHTLTPIFNEHEKDYDRLKITLDEFSKKRFTDLIDLTKML